MKLLEKIFSAKNTYIYKDFTILGKQIRCINTKKFKQYFKSLPLMVHAKSRYGKALKAFYTLIAAEWGGAFVFQIVILTANSSLPTTEN